MGSTVLATKVAGAPYLRAYTHCQKDTTTVSVQHKLTVRCQGILRRSCLKISVLLLLFLIVFSSSGMKQVTTTWVSCIISECIPDSETREVPVLERNSLELSADSSKP